MEDLDADPIVLRSHKGKVLSVDISPDKDNPMVVSSDTNSRIYVWEPITQKLADKVCEAVWRNLSGYEWNHYITKDIPYAPTCEGIEPATAVNQH
ncbi:MAG: hypothetical protein GY807_20280 [Gammaproteobacteria bacterium]|nr:hypothetical protein [Gammaproteobacteria bacterium]